MDTTHLSGALKVAVLIHSMGEKVSKDILSRMGEAEKKLVQQHLSQIDSISPEVVEKIAQEFAMLAEKIKHRQSGKQVRQVQGKEESLPKPFRRRLLPRNRPRASLNRIPRTVDEASSFKRPSIH